MDPLPSVSYADFAPNVLNGSSLPITRASETPLPRSEPHTVMRPILLPQMIPLRRSLPR